MAHVFEDRSRRAALKLRHARGARQAALKALGHRLNGRQRIVEFVPENTDEALPRLALFIAQGAAQIAEHNQIMRQATLAERPAAHAPAPRPSREAQFHRARRFAFEARLKAKLRRRESKKALAWSREKSLTGAVHQTQLPVIVEGEDGDVDFFHYRAQQTGGF